MKTLIARIALLSALLLPPVAMADSGSVLRFDATQLQAAARSGFPVEHALLEGFASLTLTDPQVRIPVPGERLQLQMDYDVMLANGDRLENGNVVVSSGLRYDPGTRGLHLVDPQLEHVGTGAAGRGLPGGSREALQQLIREYANTRPLYRLTDEDLAQVPGTLSAESLRIDDGHVELRLAPGTTP
ncbi:DUF1439 domain-containing protein [Pseudoxanthomonas sp. LH2527]|uniref:DUF1439 domain-containing protein n=1 Tax=Pseudoxanthomonas sp. LH2527 TaxID=2923249 RepID=UPI001F12B2EB|nr:DUF1439 domain-containing protein [Pseudoxanthomonas sp. LH2527]MCH6483200.1 DUF1439 domain-containing protein [Pseudoxanthomonas sp. LH2527]